ncbi:hypothetical protein [Mesobacterium pallidum]|uniref:hypothetical protein n=1 Tax=Mesobacterium pallidum TaxID=2872037 RepID=UPI001EE17C61|nr:hypothetical protein [Mesobacterium pallidum]
MTMTSPMDINDFCALPTHIATHHDGGGSVWYVLDQPLIEALGLPYGFHHADFLERCDTFPSSSSDCDRR